MFNRYISAELRSSQEFQSGVVRLLVWVLMLLMLGIAGTQGVYDMNWELFTLLFSTHLAWYLAILIHVMRRPQLIRPRTYLSVVADMSGTSLCIFLSGNPISPFALLYVLSFLSQGTRYGRNNLIATSIVSLISFSIVSAMLDGWSRSPIELGFMLLFLVTLPLYQYTLLNKLHAAKQAAETANQARGNFLATMTHELRTPLSGVIGMAGLLNGTRMNDEQKEYLDSINASAQVLQSLIGDILDLSKIDAGKLELKAVRFDIRDTLVEIATALSNQALDKGVEVVCRVDPAVPELVYGDELRFRQILFNLVGNAIKFTEEGEVCIGVTMESADEDLAARHLRVSVRDTGIGIQSKKLAEIFDSFWQADSTTTRRFGGTGLGTTIARDLTALMDGVIGVESEEGKGSTFWIKLPMLDSERLSAPQPPALLRHRRVLVMEHNDAGAEALRDACRAADMQVSVVSRIEELGALSSGGKAEPVDLLLVSDSPNGMDLTGLASMMRNILGRNVPVIYLHYPRRKVALSESNAVSLSKPFSMVALWHSLASALQPEYAHALQADAAGLGFEEDSVGASVLVAEDDTINAKLIRSLLGKAGHQVTLVRDGEAALKAATADEFDIALIDLRMPRMDGIDFTKAYRAQEKTGERLPIIALTANAAEDARAECIEAGMDEFLTKPVDPPVLEELMRSFGATQ